MDREGVVCLGWGENGYREITNRVRPIVEPEDLKGLRIRVVGTALLRDTFRALGANVMMMNWSEAQIAFQQGSVDGQENPVNVVVIPYRLWQYHKHITLWHYAVDPLILGVNARTWKSFSSADRKLIGQAAQEALAWEKAQAREGLTGEMAALKKLETEGMEVVRLTGEQFKAFQEKVQRRVDRMDPQDRPEVGQDRVQGGGLRPVGAGLAPGPVDPRPRFLGRKVLVLPESRFRCDVYAPFAKILSSRRRTSPVLFPGPGITITFVEKRLPGINLLLGAAILDKAAGPREYVRALGKPPD